MTLLQLQQLFASLVPRLIDHAIAQGMAVTLGDAYRTPQQAAANAANGAGIAHSLHCDRLAIDLNLFRGDGYLSDSESYRELGQYWKSLNPLCCWGGDFKSRPDGNHFSIGYGGRK